MNQEVSLPTRSTLYFRTLTIGWLLLAAGCSSQDNEAAPNDAAVTTTGSTASTLNPSPAVSNAPAPSASAMGSASTPSSSLPVPPSSTPTGSNTPSSPENSAGAPTSNPSAGAGGSLSNGGGGSVNLGGADTNGSSSSGGSSNGGVNSSSGGVNSSSGGAAGSEAMGGAAGSAENGGSSGAGGAAEPAGPPMHREFILYNDVPGELLYVNNDDPALNWRVSTGAGRDLQLIGNGRVLLGKSDGWDEYQLSDGALVGGVSSLAGTQATHRLADGNTVVASIADGDILLRLADTEGNVVTEVRYEGYGYVRLVRPTAQGNFLVTADTVVFEGDAAGNVVWDVTIPGDGLHVWKAMRLANGNTAIATGYAQTLQIYDPAGALLQTIGGTPELDEVYPEFFADFHQMPSGNFFVVNSQADRTEDRSVQLLEFNASGTLVWQQKQPEGVTSVEAAIVLDGLDLSKLHVEPEGRLLAVP